MSSIQDVIGYIEKKYIKKFNLIIRNHPVENKVILKKWNDGNQLTDTEIFNSCDLFFGLGSTMLILAKIYGLKVINLDEAFNIQPFQFNYNEEIWHHLKENLFLQGQINNTLDKTFLGDLKIIDYFINEL